MKTHYSISENGIFWTIQGEGHLRGFQMAFVRLGGCSVACPGCDTNYKSFERIEAKSIADRVSSIMPADIRDGWVWITGGEPSDYELRPLLSELKSKGYSTAVATSGSRRIIHPVDWLSVSPHGLDPAKFQQRYGSEIKLIDGLNGLDIEKWLAEFPDNKTDFMYRYVQPLWIGDAASGREDPASLERCIGFLQRNPRWALSRQDHKLWKIP